MGASLITLQDYKNYENITGTGQDVQISSIIPKVSEFVKGICRRTFVDWIDEQKTEVFSGGPYLVPAEIPIIQISSFEKSTNYGQSYTSLTEFTDWVLDRENQVILPINSLKTFENFINGYRLVYNAGYETLPEDLKLATLDLVTYYLKHEGAIHSQIAVTTGNAQVQYIYQSNLPTHIKRVLDLYVMNYN